MRGAAAFTAALAVRAWLLVEWRRTPYWGYPQLDDQVHLLWAREIAAGHWLRGRAFYQSPLYPYLLALVLKATGSETAMLWLQAFAGAGACAALGEAARRRHGARAGLVAGLLAAFYGPFLFQGIFLLKETWLILFLSLFLLEETAPRGRAASARAGLWLGLAALCKGNALALAAEALWARRGERRDGAAFALALALTILPATVHNWAAGGGFVPISATSGFSAYIGNNPEANGTVKYPLGVSSNPLREEEESRALAERAEGRALTAGEASRFWTRRALAFALTRPGRWLALTAFKARLFLDAYELPDNYDPYFLAERFGGVLSWPLVRFPLAATLGLLGAAALGGPEAACAALYAATVVLTFVSERYRAPVGAFLLPLAGGFLAALFGGAKARARLQGAWKRLAVVSPLVVLCWLPLVRRAPQDDAAGWTNLAQAQLERGDAAGSLESFYRAAAVSPAGLPAGAFLFGGAAAEKLGDPAKARQLYGAGLELHPGADYLRERMGLLPPPARAAGPKPARAPRANLKP